MKLIHTLAKGRKTKTPEVDLKNGIKSVTDIDNSMESIRNFEFANGEVGMHIKFGPK